MDPLASHHLALRAAQGYLELQMHDDALAELDALPVQVKREPPVLELRLLTLMQARRWDDALDAGYTFCALTPAKPIGFIHTAYILHELGRTTEARDFLLSGPEDLGKDAVFHYNLACYECVLGNLDLARAHLDRSFTLDKKYRAHARTDPDLRALRETDSVGGAF